MSGAIIGDIAGSHWEFNPTDDYNFEMFSDRNSFTDDTICTIAVADALLNGSEDYGNYIHRWCRKYPCPMGGYGGRFAGWVASDDPKPYNSFGNGSAMRVSPVGWWFSDMEDILKHARMTAECTHNHEQGIIGAQAVASAIYGCRMLSAESGDKVPEKDSIFKALEPALGYYSSKPGEFRIDISEYAGRFDETCQGTVPVALWIVLNSTGFEDAVRQAVALGADADTLGAITGSIAEALWGIPGDIEQAAMAYLQAEMKEVLEKFRESCKGR
ncbi:MAG: ADP-ribosylglycohydrolase family protein [Candidatus Cryptobacteroides sp.]